MVAARVFFCLLARGSGAGGNTGGISGLVSPCTMLHGMKTESFDDGDCTGTVTTSDLVWDSCVSHMTKNNDDTVTWKSLKSYAEMLTNGTFVYKKDEPYTGKGCEDDKKGMAATPVAMDKCKMGGEKSQYTSHCGKFLKYAEFSGDDCDDTDDHSEGFVVPMGTCYWVSNDGDGFQCPDRKVNCNDADRVAMPRFATIECDGNKVCTVKSFSDSMCKNKHEYWADYSFTADSSCQTVKDKLYEDSVRYNSDRNIGLALKPTDEVIYMKLSIDGAYTGEDGSSGIRMSQAVGCLMFAVAYTSQ